jgi:soluble lytic murein transglycosylase-like protein
VSLLQGVLRTLVRRAAALLLGVVAVVAGVGAGAAAAQPAPPLLPPAAAARYRAELVRAAHGQWGLTAPVALLAAQVHAESAWQPQAVSRVGARGLAQFMPATATWWCAAQRTAAADCVPENPTWALRAMVGYDRWLFERLAAAGEEPDRLWAMLRAYNGGLGHWQAEARNAAGGGTARPTRAAVDAACGTARRHVSHCAENLGYPHRIMRVLQPRYSGWGRVVAVNATGTAAPTGPTAAPLPGLPAAGNAR